MTDDLTNKTLQKIERAVIASLTKQEKPLTVAEAAEFLNMEKSTLSSKISRGEVPAHKMPAGQYYLYASEINAFIKGEYKNAQ